MLIFILVFSASSSNTLQVYSDTLTGTCEKMMSTFVKVYLPDNPLVYLSIHILLRDLDPPLSEYPKPKPAGYIRYDGVPNERVYDNFLDLSNKAGFLIQSYYPKFSQLAIIRIDGGLLNEFHMLNAYAVLGWRYEIEVKAYYCYSTFFTILPWDYYNNVSVCGTNLEEIDGVSSGLVPSIFYVPDGTAEFSIVSKGTFTISPYNYITSPFVNSVNYVNPLSG